MEFVQTSRQVPRGTRPDAETVDKVILIKRVSEMRATYQVRLLAYLASRQGKKLVIEVPNGCRIHPSLDDLKARSPGLIEIART